MIEIFKEICSEIDLDQICDNTIDDPLKKSHKKRKNVKLPKSVSCQFKCTPSFTIRQRLKEHCLNQELIPYGLSSLCNKTSKYLHGGLKRKCKKEMNMCRIATTSLSDLPLIQNIEQFKVTSPEHSQFKVKPRDVSPTPSMIVPIIGHPKGLDMKKPKSGTFVNDSERSMDYDSFDFMYDKKPRPGFEKEINKAKQMEKEQQKQIQHYKDEKKEKEPDNVETGTEQGDDGGKEEQSIDEEELSEEEEIMDKNLFKAYKREIDVVSMGTSYHTKDYEIDEESEKKMPLLYAETSRRTPLQIPDDLKKGTLQSHSLTKLRQPTLDNFIYAALFGTIHQGSECFNKKSRNNQGLPMCVIAYCYSLIKKPSSWEVDDVNCIIYTGHNLYEKCKRNSFCDCYLGPKDIPKYIQLYEKKICLEVTVPQILGCTYSDSENVYNLTKGINVFFSINKAGILQINNTYIALWRHRGLYFMFDANPRNENLYLCPDGNAMMAAFQNLTAVISVLLKRSMTKIAPFSILAIKINKIMNKNEEEFEPDKIDCEYNIVNNRKVVIQGSINLTDRRFGFTRNKQALSIVITALILSKMKDPCSWCRKTIDKILIIGNRLHYESVRHNVDIEPALYEFPGDFKIGPYEIQVCIKTKIYVDFICRDGMCILEDSLESFFRTSSTAILTIGENIFGIWKNNDLFFCFDPYSRDADGHSINDGAACISIHSDLDSLIWMMIRNYFNKSQVFCINALSVCRIRYIRNLDCNFRRNAIKKGTPGQHVTRNRKIRKFPFIQVLKDCRRATDEIPTDLADGESLIQVDRGIKSFHVLVGHISKINIKERGEKIADLDSPSLSETQIKPVAKKETEEYTRIVKVDIPSYQAALGVYTAEEEGDEQDEPSAVPEARAALETQAAPKPPIPEGAENEIDEEEVEEEEEGDYYLVANASTEIGLDSYERIDYWRTHDSTSKIKLEVLEPIDRTKTLGRKRRVFYESSRGSIVTGYEPEPHITQSEELNLPTNFVDLPDFSQIVRGRTNIAEIAGGSLIVEYLAPFVCIMAAAISKKFSLSSWSPDIVDYTMRCGLSLYEASSNRYDEVEKILIPIVSLGSTDLKIEVDYVFDTILQEHILEIALDRILFVKSNCGVFVTTTYSCAVMYHHHLYYLYDCYGNNEIGLSQGLSNKGYACISRFRNLKHLVQRIIYNKSIREEPGACQYCRFVVSQVKVTILSSPKPIVWDEICSQKGEDDEWVDVEEEEYKDSEVEAEEEVSEIKEKPVTPPYEGWIKCGGIATLRGSTAIPESDENNLNTEEDYFASISACLMIIEKPIEKWNPSKIDYCIELGKTIYDNNDDLCFGDKRIIKNLLIGKHLFNIIVKRIKLRDCNNEDLNSGLNTLLQGKLNCFLLQRTSKCNVLYCDSKYYYLFEPHGIDEKGNPLKSGKAGWIRYKCLSKLKTRLGVEHYKNNGLYAFYNLHVTCVNKAPKKLLKAQKVVECTKPKPEKRDKEPIPLHEDVNWLLVDPVPWSRIRKRAPSGKVRGTRENMWFSWDIEIIDDLYSLIGSLHQSSSSFSFQTRGKQTLCNLVMSIAMLQIYNLKTWNYLIIDSVLINGDNYCNKCFSTIQEKNYEFDIDDLLENCELYPYSFKLDISVIARGTMFLLKPRSYNLYKALRVFFDNNEKRFGILSVTKYNGQRYVAIGKLNEDEYFMFDCQSIGKPMFNREESVAYILRTTTLNRLVYVITLTVRGGHFFLYEVKTTDLIPVNLM